MGEDLSRRSLIRRGSTGVAAVGIASLAGCTGSIPFVGGDEYGGVPMGNWLADPAFEELLDTSGGQDFEISESTRTDAEFEYVLPEPIFEYADELDGYQQLQGGSAAEFRDRVGVPASDLDWQLTQSLSWEWENTRQTQYGRTTTAQQRSTVTIDILGGAFEAGDVEDTLENWAGDSLSSEGEYEGYDFYDTGNAAIGVGEEAIIRITSDQSNIDHITALEITIDANVDGSPRLTDDDDANELLSQFDQGHINRGVLTENPEERFGTGSEEAGWETGLIGRSRASSIDGESAEISVVFLYESERNAVADEVETYVERNRDIYDEFATLEDYSVEEDGRSVTVTGTVETQAYF
ncbi:hypothetical protein [Halostagnicola kamekurae]|uniref:Uncharacterized protein n=1 Tax=Halostagnicola kamekurae TaxID=619731 RepID=A0A1I6SRT4_9EURY|nr:hypothetical protein [Halostagnicola kamekurae]SFS79579.1 hypothetical protein SAMN04488556_2865 [Halostagnicola kamekurae]